MISALKKLISSVGSIINGIVSAFKFLVLLIQGLIELIGMIPSAIEYLLGALNALPTPLVAFASAGVTICVIFLLVGRSKSN